MEMQCVVSMCVLKCMCWTCPVPNYVWCLLQLLFSA